MKDEELDTAREMTDAELFGCEAADHAEMILHMAQPLPDADEDRVKHLLLACALMARSGERSRRRQREAVNRDNYPECSATRMWDYLGTKCSIVLRESEHEWQPELLATAYARFPSKPLQAHGYDDFARYVPVHGGMTFAQDYDDGSYVYGFDCQHADDEEHPWTRDEAWLTEETQRMVRAIWFARDYEYMYLQEDDTHYRAHVIQRYHEDLVKDGVEFELTNNFGAMIALLGGSL